MTRYTVDVWTPSSMAEQLTLNQRVPSSSLGASTSPARSSSGFIVITYHLISLVFVFDSQFDSHHS